MVKIISRSVATLAMFICLLALTSPAIAQSSNTTTTQPDVCGKMQEFTKTATTQLNDRLSQLSQSHHDQANQLAAERTQSSQKLTQARTQWGEKMAQQYDKLTSKAADSEAKKNAILAFRTGVEAAIIERQKKIDSTIAAYRAELDNLTIERNQAVDQAARLLGDTLNQAFEQANATCNDDAVTARQALIIKISAARQTFRDRIMMIETGVDTKISELKAHQGEIDLAVDKFTQKAKSFRDSLKNNLED